MASSDDIINAKIWLHWKQGDDLMECIQRFPDNHIAVRATLNSYIGRFQSIIQSLETIRDLIPLEQERKFDISGDTHMIYFSGPAPVLNEMKSRNLINLESDFGNSEDEKIDEENEDQNNTEDENDEDDITNSSEVSQIN